MSDEVSKADVNDLVDESVTIVYDGQTIQIEQVAQVKRKQAKA